MGVVQVKALMTLAGNPRALGWEDARSRSPKAKDDFSSVILSRIGTKGTPAVQDIDYDLLSQVYICNDMAWTCINLVSSTAALGKLKVRRRIDKEITYLPDHPLQRLLDFPNSSMTQFDLIQAYVVHQLLFGNVTLLLIRQEMASMCEDCVADGCTDCIHKFFIHTTSPVVQIMPIHPSNIVQRISQKDGKKYFFYKPGTTNGYEYLIHPDNMVSDPFYNPDISWYGVSPTFLLKRWLDLDEAMTSQITDFFMNGAIPSMIVSLKPGTNFTYNEEPHTLVEKMKAKWMEQFSSNGKSQKSPAFVYGDIDVQKIQEKVEEQVGKNLYYEIQGHVCATYGVPPTVYEFGLKYGAQRAAAEQQERDFYNRTISKILSRIERKFTNLLLAPYGDPTLEIAWDLSELGIASFIIDRKEKRALDHWKLGLIKRNEARVLLSYEPVEDEFADDYYRITVMGDGQGNVSGNQLGPADNNLTGLEGT